MSAGRQTRLATEVRDRHGIQPPRVGLWPSLASSSAANRVVTAGQMLKRVQQDSTGKARPGETTGGRSPLPWQRSLRRFLQMTVRRGLHGGDAELGE